MNDAKKMEGLDAVPFFYLAPQIFSRKKLLIHRICGYES